MPVHDESIISLAIKCNCRHFHGGSFVFGKGDQATLRNATAGKSSGTSKATLT